MQAEKAVNLCFRYPNNLILALQCQSLCYNMKLQLCSHNIEKSSPLICLQFIHQNGGFTKVWVSLKTIFFPTMVAIMVWFWRRISLLTRPPALLEYMLMVLGAALTFLNCESTML